MWRDQRQRTAGAGGRLRLGWVRILSRTALAWLLLVFASCLLAQNAPLSGDHPWHAVEEQTIEADARNSLDTRFHVDPAKTYSLAELVDLAEAHNPETRFAWERARAQAAALGIAQSELYPTLAAAALSETGRDQAFFGNRFYSQSTGDLQVALDLTEDHEGALVLEPPAYQLHRYRPQTGIVSHMAYVERYPGPFPFLTADPTER